MRILILLAAVSVIAAPAFAGEPPPIGGALEAPAAWDSWKNRFVSAGGRVVDNGNKDVSHSEGQGYGMLLAVAADDRPTFDRLWRWTQARLYVRDDGLAAWRWDPVATPHIQDRNNATDGDLLIAWALAEAGAWWSVPGYKAEARRIALAVGAEAVTDAEPVGKVLLPGAEGFGVGARTDGPVVNLSYWVWPAFARLHTIAPEVPWDVLARNGIALGRLARFGPQRLPADWIALRGGTPQPAAGFAATFGYDAIRVPLYLAWAGEKDELEAYDTLWREASATPSVIDLGGGKPGDVLADEGYGSVAALTRCAVHGRKLPFDLTTGPVEKSYPSTLRLLVLIAVRRSYPECL